MKLGEETRCLGLAMLFVATVGMGDGCSLYQIPAEPEFAPPEKPGDRCSEWIELGQPHPCPDGMVCTGAKYEKRKLIQPNRCQVATGRCASRDDCAASEICVRKSAAIGYCAPVPDLVPVNMAK